MSLFHLQCGCCQLHLSWAGEYKLLNPLRAISQLANLVGLVDVLGVLLSGIGLKSWGAWGVRFKPFISQTDAPGLSFLLFGGMLCQGWGLWWNCVPVSPNCCSVVYSHFFQCVVVSWPHLVFLEECSICSCRLSVSLTRGEFRIFLNKI